MALANYAAFRNAKPYARVTLGKNNISTIAGRVWDGWALAPFAGGSVTGALDATNAGVLRGTPTGIATYISKYIGSHSAGGVIVIYDRLVQTNGLDATLATVQTTNLPTPALTRYTNGVGVMMMYDIYGSIGTTAATLSVSYTNSAGTAGRTSPAITVGGTNDRTANMVLQIPLQVGDVGVKSVESVTFSGTTGTAGVSGITLWKPLLAVPSPDMCTSPRMDMVRQLGAFFEKVQQDACLAVMHCSATTTLWLRSSAIELIKAV
jgi:hypothetical protein